ncbi:MAG: Grx4 family monothiol glutaredoxin [Gammaproteobacteria bacterium]|nr:Grx4 family monothiol glutaredoxin [Gammaproteobacteria bacterium]
MDAENNTRAIIEKQIKDCPILLYMKGSPEFPQCGFSARAVQILAECGFKFSYVDILQNPDIRKELPIYSNWPTFPQLYVAGELLGGSDIMIEMHGQEQLKEKLQQAADATE